MGKKKRLSKEEYEKYEVIVIPTSRGRKTRVTEKSTGFSTLFLGAVSKADAIRSFIYQKKNRGYMPDKQLKAFTQGSG